MRGCFGEKDLSRWTFRTNKATAIDDRERHRSRGIDRSDNLPSPSVFEDRTESRVDRRKDFVMREKSAHLIWNAFVQKNLQHLPGTG